MGINKIAFNSIDLLGIDEQDWLDLAEICDCLVSEYDEIKKHRDMLGDGYIELDISSDLE